MLPIELTVRLDAGSAFGSGILIGQRHVLTCAHVIEPNYSRANYIHDYPGDDAMAGINDQPAHNAKLRERLGRLSVEAVTYDGIFREVSLLAVHDYLDLVLLELATPVRHPICLPPLQTDFNASKTIATTGFGFQLTGTGTGNDAYSIWSESLTLTAPDDDVSATRSSTLNGRANEGMSGGPVVAQFADGQLQIIGMLTMGGSKQANCGVVRADLLAKFVRRHLGDTALDFNSGNNYGFLPEFLVSVGETQTAACWLPLPRETRSTGDYGNSLLRFIASRPLTFADIDTVTGYQPGEQMRAQRRRFFAPMTVAEAKQTVLLFAEKFGEHYCVPDLSAQRFLQPFARREAPQPTKTHLRPELMLAPEWNAKLCPQHGGAVFPSCGASEWVEDDETWHIAFCDGAQRDWDYTPLRSPVMQANTKALLRPVLSIPIWAATA